MADAPTQTGSGIWPLLVARYGIQGALSLLPLFAPGQSDTARGFGAANLAGKAAGLAGLNPKVPIGGFNVPVIPGALAAAGLGYDLSQIASNPNYSLGQKVGHSAFDAAQLGGAIANPYVALGVIARGLVGQLTKSGSPQVAATGRALQGPALPVEGLISVLTGDMSPREAGNNMIASTGRIPIVGHAMKQAMQAFGLGTPPTTGTVFRKELDQVVGANPILRGLDTTKYNIDPNYYNSLTPEARNAGATLGALLAGRTYDSQKDPKAYSIQAQNALLNQYGNKTPDILAQVSAAGQQALNPQPQPMPSNPTIANDPTVLSPYSLAAQLQKAAQGTQMTQFKPGLPNSIVPNKTQGIIGTLLAR